MHGNQNKFLSFNEFISIIHLFIHLVISILFLLHDQRKKGTNGADGMDGTNGKRCVFIKIAENIIIDDVVCLLV